MVTTFTTTAAEDIRIAAAFGSILGLGVPANQAQVKGAVVAWVTNTVQDYERRAAQAAFVPNAPISPT